MRPRKAHLRLLLAFVLLPSSLVLMSGCPDKKPKYPICKKDKDCEKGEFCINNRCAQCGPGKECPDGKKCMDGTCRAPDYCKSADDCADGQVCKDNKCTGCDSDAECGEDKRCSNGACLARGACKADEDCADDEDCIDGMCKRPGRTPPPDVTCKLETVYFGFDSFSVDGENGKVLETNATCLKEASDRSVMLNGYTDPRGTEEYNVALSEKRANAVADYLARIGIDPARFHVVPKGEGLSTGTDEASYSKDRKVEFEWK